MARRTKKIEKILPDADILNPMQRAVYEVIRKYVEENNISPSIREIAGLVGISKSNVPNIMTVLEKKGFLRQIPNTPRGIVLTLRAAPGSVSIPIIGTIAAGVPVFAPENYDGSIELSADFVPRGELFALTISGDSMTGANILNGDLAIIKREIEARNNDIVAALIDGEATLKRFYQKEDVVWLMPENPEYQPIIISDEQIPFMILGKLVATIRKY